MRFELSVRFLILAIACYYWGGSFATDSEGEAALDGFFDAASPNTRAALIGQIAWIWEKHSGEAIEEKTIKKILRIWERRFAQIEKALKASNGTSAEFDGEHAESIDWLSCECFPFEWRFRHAKSSLDHLKKAPRAYKLLKAISEFGAMPAPPPAALIRKTNMSSSNTSAATNPSPEKKRRYLV